MFKIAICDESSQQADELARALELLAEEISLECSVEQFRNIRAFQKALTTERFGMVFLDTRIGGQDGIEFARRLRYFDAETAIVFCTEDTGSALAAYAVFPSGYLIRPVSGRQLREVFRYVADKIRKLPNIVLHGAEGGEQTVGIEDILYIEVFGERLDVHAKSGVVHCTGTLAQVAELLPEQSFCRAHRSYIVNFRYATGIERYTFRMMNGDSVAIAKNRYAEVKSAYLAFAGKRKPPKSPKAKTPDGKD